MDVCAEVVPDGQRVVGFQGVDIHCVDYVTVVMGYLLKKGLV